MNYFLTVFAFSFILTSVSNRVLQLRASFGKRFFFQTNIQLHQGGGVYTCVDK